MFTLLNSLEASAMEVQDLATIDSASWDSLVNASDDTWLWHTWRWIEDVARLDSLETRYFVARLNGTNVGGFPLQIPTSGRMRRAYSLMRGSAGPFCIRQLSPSVRLGVLQGLTSAAIRWAREKTVVSLSCSLPPLAKNNLSNSNGVNPLVTAGWRDVSTHTRIASLLEPEPTIWARLTHDARRQVKLAKSRGYTVERGDWNDLLEEYYLVHTETYRRTGAVPHPKSYFRLIAGTAVRGEAALWVGRDPSGKAVAFHNCARFKSGSVYNTGCCKTDHLRSGINYMLFWQALIGAKQDGCMQYEIGEVFPGVLDGKLRGLTVFKEKFDGELYPYYRAEIRLFDTAPKYIRLAAILPRPIRKLLKSLTI